jgi:predicted amidohydrolase YtcJ
LKDAAQSLIGAVIPAPSKDQLKQAIKTAIQHANSLGVTSIQDNSSGADLEIYQELLKEGELTLRINAWRGCDHYKEFESIGILPLFGNDMLRIGTMKVFVDGSMGAGTALFYQPYSDDSTTSGIPIYQEDQLYELIKSIDNAGLQIAAHAIGDKANTWILNAFEKAFQANGRRDARHRIEHAQVVLPEDIKRYKELGIIASIQPSHCIDDMRWAEKRIGDRAKHSYLFNSFVKAGVKIAFGTDWTVEPLNPMLGLYAAATREFPEGGPEGGWFPDEKITMEQAIEFYTLGAAYAEFQENQKGSIKAGKLADLVVLDKNLFEIEPQEILDTKADLTILGGKVVFKK